ncbi:17174_t:CDS:1, partial [Funneliformis geosporum]
MANAADLIDIAQDNLPISSIFVFLTGFIVEIKLTQSNNLFKIIKLNVTEFAGNPQSGPIGKTFILD